MRIRVVSEVRSGCESGSSRRSDPGRVYPGQNLGLNVSIIVKVVVMLNGKFMFNMPGSNRKALNLSLLWAGAHLFKNVLRYCRVREPLCEQLH